MTLIGRYATRPRPDRNPLETPETSKEGEVSSVSLQRDNYPNLS